MLLRKWKWLFYPRAFNKRYWFKKIGRTLPHHVFFLWKEFLKWVMLLPGSSSGEMELSPDKWIGFHVLILYLRPKWAVSARMWNFSTCCPRGVPRLLMPSVWPWGRPSRVIWRICCSQLSLDFSMYSHRYGAQDMCWEGLVWWEGVFEIVRETRVLFYVDWTISLRLAMVGPDFLQLSCDYDLNLPFPVYESCPPHKQLRLSTGENYGMKGPPTDCPFLDFAPAWYLPIFPHRE